MRVNLCVLSVLFKCVSMYVRPYAAADECIRMHACTCKCVFVLVDAALPAAFQVSYPSWTCTFLIIA